MQADVVRVTLPATVHHLTMQELGEVLGPRSPEYPASVTIACDGCDNTIRVEIVVRNEVTTSARLTLGRIYATSKGWTTDENGDLCPKHLEGTP